jgi:H+-transporting ATPase
MTLSHTVKQSPTQGLTTVEASRLHGLGDSNTLAEAAVHPARLALSKLWSPIPWMLEAAVVFQIVLGEYAEAAVVGLLLLFNAGLSYFQEGRSQATMRALQGRLALTASVERDGSWVTLPAAEVVKGDRVTLSLGTVVPADVTIVGGSALIDQSMLTGESVPLEAEVGARTYAGALVRRGEATATVTATGADTRFGQSAALVRDAHVESTEQKAIFRVVRDLALFNGGVTVLLIGYAFVLHLPLSQIAPLAVVAILASIPVALPSMFTLAATVGARSLARRGVLPTRLSTLDEAAGVDVLVVDKTGTLTRNALTVSASRPSRGFNASRLLALAAIASSPAGADPVDAAIRLAAASSAGQAGVTLTSFSPFDPNRKLATAEAQDGTGAAVRVVKGAYSVVAALCVGSADAEAQSSELERSGYRVLAVGVGPDGAMRLAGLIAMSDPVRDDARDLVQQLRSLGIRTVMATGDAVATAETVARQVGIVGTISTVTPLAPHTDVDKLGVLAGILPADKFALIQQLQALGHVVAMCGDGVNDAPALRQAQMGVAVLGASDVARSAAGIVLTEPGLAGIVSAVEEGRTTFQRILTYTLRSVTRKVVQVLFLLGGLLLTGQAIITPVLMVIMMISGDFLAMSSSTDRVRPSKAPDVWRIGNLTIASVVLGACNLAFCTGFLLLGRDALGLDPTQLQTLAAITLVFSGQSVFYVARERQHLWSSRPSRWVVLSSVADITIIAILSFKGILMAPLPLGIITAVAVSCVLLAFVLDGVKTLLFRRLRIF